MDERHERRCSACSCSYLLQSSYSAIFPQFNSQVKMLLLTYFFFSALVYGARVFGQCPVTDTPTYPVRENGDFCYQFHIRESREFAVAQRECKNLGGTEVMIKDQSTQQFLYDTLRSMRYGGVVWIGLSDSALESHWVWIDGTPVTYTNWASGEPSLTGEAEDCAAMDMADNGQWYSYRCEDVLFFEGNNPYICQFSTLPPTTVDPFAESTPEGHTRNPDHTGHQPTDAGP